MRSEFVGETSVFGAIEALLTCGWGRLIIVLHHCCSTVVPRLVLAALQPEGGG